MEKEKQPYRDTHEHGHFFSYRDDSKISINIEPIGTLTNPIEAE